MAGYDDTRNKILESLLQRPVGTEINPENHQDFALSLLDYIRSVELISGSTLIGIAYQDTVPVQSNNSNGVYIAGVAQGSTVVFQNFRDVNGNQLTVTTEDTESKLVILIWNRQYWSKHEISANVISQAENAYYNLTIRKQYESEYAMNSDKKSPIGNDGRAIRRGEIVSVRNPSNSNENGLYSYELDEHKIPYWQLQTKLSTLADRIIDGGGASGRLDLIQNRRDTNENWEEQNPVLAEGEIGFVVDQNYYKIGDGVSSWKNLQRIGYYDVDINKWLEYDRKNIYSLQEGAGCLQFDGFTEVTGLGGILFNTKDSYRYEVLYSTTSKSFILSVVDESDGIGKKVGNFLFWPEIKTETKTIPSSESYKRRDVLFYIFTPNVGSVYYYIDDDGNASEKSSTYIIKKQLDSVKNSIIKEATVEYYDHSVTDGPDRINTRANIKFLDANGNQLFNAVLFGAGNGYPGLLSLKNKSKLDNYADTFVTNPVASSESNGLMSAEDKIKLDSIGESEIIDLPWDDDVNGQDGYVNNFTERGEYHIHGERLYANDGLPILNAASGHTIDGRMTVLDSSLPNGNKYDVCVTQILRLNNRVGGDGHIFIRTGIAATKAELQKPTAGGWSPWEKLMGVFEKNAVSNATDLNKYTSSGMYDGMFVFSSASQTIGGLKIESGSTFLMVAVNGYAVASAGVVPQVTQLLYLMPSGLDGSSGVRNAEVYTRTGIYAASTKTYTWGKFDGLAHASDIAKVLGYLQETDNLVQENQSAITALGKTASALQGSVDTIEEHGLSDVNFIQEENGSLSVEKLKLKSRTTKSEFPLATTAAAGVMSVADKTKVDNYPEQFVLDLGIVESQAYGEREAAKSEVAGNRNISFIRFQVRGVNDLKTTLIMQWPNGIHETAQIMCVDKQQWRRNVTGATGVVGAPTNAFKWERTAPHSIDYDEQRRIIQLKDYENRTVSQEVELPLATSSKPGLMSSADKTKLDNVDIAAIQAKNLEQDTRIAALLQDTPWGGKNMNAFTEMGEYHIHGERTDANDGLPILNAASGHTIDARLTVLDSSLTNGTGAKTDTVVTQILRLSNRTGGDGHVYVRTAQAANKSQIATPSSTAWSTWEKLMGVFEKNAVTNIADLDTYTTNGMYSGLFADTALQSLGGLQFTPGDSFLLITVNGYAASAFGTPQLTQMLYRLPSKQGSEQFPAKMYIRTAWWNASAKDWVWNYWDKIVTASELSALEARVAALEAK